MGGADRAERRGQFALHGVARGLRRRGDERERRPRALRGENSSPQAAAGIDFGGLGEFGDLALLVVDQQEQVEIADASAPPPVRLITDCRQSSLCAFCAASTDGQI